MSSVVARGARYSSLLVSSHIVVPGHHGKIHCAGQSHAPKVAGHWQFEGSETDRYGVRDLKARDVQLISIDFQISK